MVGSTGQDKMFTFVLVVKTILIKSYNIKRVDRFYLTRKHVQGIDKGYERKVL